MDSGSRVRPSEIFILGDSLPFLMNPMLRIILIIREWGSYKKRQDPKWSDGKKKEREIAKNMIAAFIKGFIKSYPAKETIGIIADQEKKSTTDDTVGTTDQEKESSTDEEDMVDEIEESTGKSSYIEGILQRFLNDIVKNNHDNNQIYYKNIDIEYKDKIFRRLHYMISGKISLIVILILLIMIN